MKKIMNATITLSLLMGTVSLLAQSSASDKPFWEVGVGISVIDVPHYAGSDEGESYALPFPYVVFKSEQLSLDREGLQGHIAKTSNWELDISFGGTLPVDSDDNQARALMPDLDWVGTVGPSFNYRFINTDDTKLKLMMPVRFGVASDFSDTRYVGWEFSPSIRWEKQFTHSDATWRWVSSASMFYFSDRFSDYYYSVDGEYATQERPTFSAEQGYGGHQILLGLTRRKENFWWGAFIRHRSVQDAVFENSPLVKQKDNVYLGLAFAYILQSSEK